jgi:hypothetical protein
MLFLSLTRSIEGIKRDLGPIDGIAHHKRDISKLNRIILPKLFYEVFLGACVSLLLTQKHETPMQPEEEIRPAVFLCACPTYATRKAINNNLKKKKHGQKMRQNLTCPSYFYPLI